MTGQYHNPFSKLGLIIPKTQRNLYDQYCQTQTIGKSNVDSRPFERMVDLWFAGFSLAARKQLKYDKPIEKPQRFNSGDVFDGEDSWRIQIIMLVAIKVAINEKGNEKGIEIVNDPSEMMNIANGLAAAGVPQIVAMLRSGSQDPIWNLSEALADFLQTGISEEEVTDSLRITNAIS